MGFTDNVNVVQEPLCTPAACQPPPPGNKRPRSRKWKRDAPSQHSQGETLCLHLNGANLLLKSNHYQFHWGQDNWLRIRFSHAKHDYVVAGCRHMLICCRLFRLEFNQRGTINEALSPALSIEHRSVFLTVSISQSDHPIGYDVSFKPLGFSVSLDS